MRMQHGGDLGRRTRTKAKNQMLAKDMEYCTYARTIRQKRTYTTEAYVLICTYFVFVHILMIFYDPTNTDFNSLKSKITNIGINME
jgi:hypothetical protein